MKHKNMISQTAEYALRATIYLAEHEAAAPLRVEQVARALDAPRNYLSKILNVMARAGLLTSLRGPAGGFRLAVQAGELNLADIVSLFDPAPERRRCLLGRPECGDANPCGAHGLWRRVAMDAAEFFRSTTVADVLKSAEAAGVPAAGVAVEEANGSAARLRPASKPKARGRRR